MNLNETFLELCPAISAIFELGFIPAPDEIYEFTAEQYAGYERSGGDISQKLYTVVPKNYKYLALSPSNEINLMSEDEIPKLNMACMFLRKYAKDGGCKSEDSEDILKFAAERLPASFTEGTRFKRPTIKKLKPGEPHLTEQEEWSDFLASLMGNATLKLKIVDQNTNETKNLSFPIKKHR